MLVRKKNLVQKFCEKNLGMKTNLGTKKYLGTKKLVKKKIWVRTKNWIRKILGTEKKLGERESSTCGELDPHSHIFGPFRQTSDKFLEGNSMNTHFGSGNAVLPTRVKM